MKGQLTFRNKQEGAVLIVSLLLLLATTFVGFSSMETSSMESKMATARELKEMTFQTAETVIEQSLDDISYISQAYAYGLQDKNPPSKKYSFESDTKMKGSSTVEFMNNANSLGYSIRKGASGIATYYYEVTSTAERFFTLDDEGEGTGNSVSSTHVQGIYVEGPSLN